MVSATNEYPGASGQVVATGLSQSVEAHDYVGFDVFLFVPRRILPFLVYEYFETGYGRAVILGVFGFGCSGEPPD
jgi:hypothetical protein